MKKKEEIKIEIDEDDIPKPKPKPKKVEKVEKMEKVEKIEKPKEDFIEVKIDEAILKIPDNRDIIIKLKNILTVLELDYERCNEPIIKEEVIKEEIIEPKPFKPKPLPKPEDLPEIEETVNVNSIDDIPTICPVCNNPKLKRGKINKSGDFFIQSIKCKKWSCPYKREFRINI